jgi:hypothetical protein
MSDAEKLEQSDVLKKRAGELFKVSLSDKIGNEKF